MPQYRQRAFQVGEYYLDRRRNSPAWYRMNFDPATKQTQKISLGTTDFEEAKGKLLEWYSAERLQKGRDLPADSVKLKELWREYEANHVHKLRSEEAVKILLRYWLEFWGDASVEDVRDIPRQEEFRDWLAAKGLSHNSVVRGVEVGRAAINRAWKRGIIRDKPFIEVPAMEQGAPMGRPLEVEEIRQLYIHAADHVRLFLVLMLGTGARNEAVLSLTWPQVDFSGGLILLNPEGRKQTSKRRPTVRLIPFVREVLEPMAKDTKAVIMFRGEKVIHINKAIIHAVRRAGLDRRVSAYSCRHTVARWLRREGVSPWEVGSQLGHKMPSFSITERYAPNSPDYLEKSSAALERLLRTAIPLDAPPIIGGR